MKTIFKSILASICIAAGVITLNAQPAGFAKVYYDGEGSVQAYSALPLADGGIFMAGIKDDIPMALTTDPSGNIRWAYKMSGMAGVFFAMDICPDSSVILAGTIDSPVTGNYDVICMKVNLNGDTLWTRMIDMGGSDEALGVEADSAGGCLLTGSAGFQDPLLRRASLVKLNPDGLFSWGRLLAFGDTSMVARFAAVLPDGGFVVTGVYIGEPFYGLGEMFLLKVDGNGTIDWSFLAHFNDHSSGLDVLRDESGLTFLVHGSNEGIGLLRTDLGGVPQWCRSYGWGGGWEPRFSKLTRTSDGGFVFVDGMPYGPGTGIRTNAAGESVGSVELLFNTVGAAEAPDGGLLFTGNGPIYGVAMTGTDHPQIGLIRTNAQLEGPECSYPGTPFWYDEEVTVTPHLFDSDPAGVLVGGEHLRVDAGLATDSGCVAFIGAVPDLPNQASRLAISPNPASGILLLETDPPLPEGICRVLIYDAFGQTVLSKEIPSAGKCRMNLGFLPDGLYLVRVYTDEGSCSGRLIIRK